MSVLARGDRFGWLAELTRKSAFTEIRGYEPGSPEAPARRRADSANADRYGAPVFLSLMVVDDDSPSVRADETQGFPAKWPLLWLVC